MSIAVKNLTKKFGTFTAVRDISFDVKMGQLVALLGPSGSGKSTLLRMIGGLEIPDAGEIHITGKEATNQAAKDRNVGFVFQHYALFKHMTVEENIGFGLAVRGVEKSVYKERVKELLKLIQLQGLGHRYPAQLSGGQRQRVALARALAPRPQVLLLDEPFGALDAKVRDELRDWITRLHEESEITTLFVTHDQHEALEIADRIIVMNKGAIEQEGTALQIFDEPSTHFVAQFVGETNYIESELCEPELVCWGPFKFSVKGFQLGDKIRIYFRPNDVYVSSVPETLQVKGTISKTRFRGPLIELTLNVGKGQDITALVPKGVALASNFTENAAVYIGITAFHAFKV